MMEPLISMVKEEPVFHTLQGIQAEDNCDNTSQASSITTTVFHIDNIKMEESTSNASRSYIKEFDIRKLNMEEKHLDSENWNSSCYTVVYRCSGCKHTRRLPRDIRTHEPTCRRDIRMVKCSKCEYVTTILTNLKLHFSRKHDMAYKEHSLYCYHCDYTSSFKSNLAEHIKRNHWVNYDTFKCNKCPYETKLREYLIKHIQRQHFSGSDSFRCTQCNYKSKYNHHLVQHMQVKHQDVHSVKCNVCPYQTKCKQYLQKHMKRVHGGPIPCPHCEYVAKCGDYLNDHVKKQHFEHWGKSKRSTSDRNRYGKIIQCSQCKFSTKYPGDLKVHVQTQHNANCIVHKCEECNYTTKHKTNLHKHVRVKHGSLKFCSNKGRIYLCTHCNFKTNYKDHISTHFTGSRQKLFHCRACKFKTDCKGYFQYHKAIADHYQDHKFTCNYTSKSLKKITGNYLEKLSNVPRSNYVCIHCGFKANYKISLNNHFQCKRVTKETFKCLECDFVTKCRPYLKLHIQNNHIKSDIVIEEEFSYLDFIKSEDVSEKKTHEEVNIDISAGIKKELCETGSEQSIVKNEFVESNFTIRNIKTEPGVDCFTDQTDVKETINNVQGEDNSVDKDLLDVIKTEYLEYGFY